MHNEPSLFPTSLNGTFSVNISHATMLKAYMSVLREDWATVSELDLGFGSISGAQ